MRRHALIAVASAAALLLAGCSAGGESDPGGEAASLAADAGSGCVTEGSDAESPPDGELSPGEHSASLLGTGVTFTTEEPWVVRSTDSSLQLLPPDPPDVAATQEVRMLRGATLEGADDSDIDVAAWAEARPEVDVRDRRETAVGACDAVVYDLAVADEMPLLSSPAGTVMLVPNQTVRMWVVEQGEQDPMVLHTSVSSLDLDWLGTADAIVDSMELAVAPGPGSEAGAVCGETGGYPLGQPTGSYTTTQFAQRQLSFRTFSCTDLIDEPGPGFVAVPLLAEDPQAGPTVLFFAPVATADGTPLADVQDLLDVAAASGNELEEAGEVTLLGRRVTGYTNVAEAVGPVALTRGQDPGMLDFTPLDITYPLDTEQGLLLVSSVADVPEDLPAAERLLRRLAGSVRWEG